MNQCIYLYNPLFFRKHCDQYEIGLDTVDPTDLDQLQKAIKKNTKVKFNTRYR